LGFYIHEASEYSPKQFVFEVTHTHDLGSEGGHLIETHRFDLIDGNIEHYFDLDYGYGDISDFAESFGFIDRIESKEDALEFVEYEKQAALARIARLDELLESLKSLKFSTTADYSELDEDEEDEEE
jgi:hypothetical protein